jgi:RHS repeat-associated protein
MLAGSIDSDNKLFQYFHDGLGSIVMICDSTGNYQNLYVYDDFGNFRMMEEAGSVPNHYYYTGQEMDESPSGLYNLRARYYATGIGRFTQEDPAGSYNLRFKYFYGNLGNFTPSLSFNCSGGCRNEQNFNSYGSPQDLNCYVYVANDPINWIDPIGLDRYEMCKGKKFISKWLCKKLVDWRCSSSISEMILCCKVDKESCIADIDFECDPDAEEKANICHVKYLLCIARGQLKFKE